MPHHRWSKYFLFAMGALAISSCTAGFPGDAVDGGAGGAGAVGAGGGAGASNGPNGGSGNGKNIVDESTDPDAGTGGTNAFTTTTTTEPGAGGAGGGSGGQGGTASDPACNATLGEPRVLFMSSDDSSSMGSAALARELLSQGIAPPVGAIRPYEFLNYYHIRYPLPTDGKLDVAVNLLPVPNTDKQFRLLVAIQGYDVIRPPMALTFVVDTSGSLVGTGLAREKAAIKAIASQLAEGDLVNFVVWSNQDTELLAKHKVTGPNDPALIALTEKLKPGGGSDLHAGLTHGYNLAGETSSDTRLSRVVLISDGGANLGVVDRDKIAKAAKNGEDQGIYLVGIGVGPAVGYSDALMNEVTDEGRGSYVYLDSEDEAEAVLSKRFNEVMDIAARAVEVELDLPAYLKISSTSAENVSGDKSEVTPQHLAPADAMVFHQYLEVIPGEAVCDQHMIGVKVKWVNPALHPNDSDQDEWAAPISDLKVSSWQFLKAEAIALYAKALRSRKTSDFEIAEAAIDTALNDPTVIAEDDHFDEVVEISNLIALFPAAEKGK